MLIRKLTCSNSAVLIGVDPRFVGRCISSIHENRKALNRAMGMVLSARGRQDRDDVNDDYFPETG